MLNATSQSQAPDRCRAGDGNAGKVKDDRKRSQGPEISLERPPKPTWRG